MCVYCDAHMYIFGCFFCIRLPHSLNSSAFFVQMSKVHPAMTNSIEFLFKSVHKHLSSPLLGYLTILFDSKDSYNIFLAVFNNHSNPKTIKIIKKKR